ncbi:MAG: hypothetical protein RBR28_03110 [Lentimicrobium sp.]|jgi:hypothetical protein|nr:hypothetical protein [Lentimicrobium sp.]
METAQLLEWFGYLASAIIALSMAMNSILKFRWINLTGALAFAVYGFLIKAYPVSFLNGIIVIVDLYYLYSFYSKKEDFEILTAKPDNVYLQRFLNFHNKDIQRFFPGYAYKQDAQDMIYFILRDMSVAGVFIASEIKSGTLKVSLDYVIPAYRDFKNGHFIYNQLHGKLAGARYLKVVSSTHSPLHSKYLNNLGFKQTSDGQFEKTLSNGTSK